MLRVPGAPSLIFFSSSSSTVNVPVGMFYILCVHSLSGSWSLAALAAGVGLGLNAAAAWGIGRFMDRYGTRMVLLWTLPGAFLPLLFLLPIKGFMLVAVTGLMGLFRPQIASAKWTSITRLMPESLRVQGFSIDAVLCAILPAAGAALIGLLYSMSGLTVTILFVVAMTIWPIVGVAFHRSASGPGTERKREMAGIFRKEVLAVLSVCAIAWGALAAMEILVGVRGGGSVMAYANALSMLGVLAGSLIAPSINSRKSLFFASFVISVCALIPFIPGLPALLVGMGVMGVCAGVVAANGPGYLTRLVQPDRTSEAMALWGASIYAGQTVLRPLAGVSGILSIPFIWVLAGFACFELKRPGRKL